MVQPWHLVVGSVLLLSVAGKDSNAQAAIAQPSGKPPVDVVLTVSGKNDSPLIPVQSELSAAVDKKPAQVISLRPAKDDTLVFAVMIDTSSSEAPKAKAIKDAALRLFEVLSHDENQGYLVLFDIQPRMSKRPLQPAEVQATLDSTAFSGGTALFDAIEQTCTKILSRSANPDVARRAILLISDGDDNYSHATMANAEATAEQEGVAIFSLAEFESDNRGQDVLKLFGKDTGGRAILANKLADGISPLLTAIDEQWVLEFEAPGAADQKLHSLVIKSSQKDMSISAPAHVPLP